jgi:hypothetical protein
MKLTKMKAELQQDLDMYEEQRQSLVKQYGDEVEVDGGKILEVRDPEKLKTFYNEVEEILRTAVNHDYDRLTWDDIKLIEDMELDITELQMTALFAYLVEEKG